MYAPDYVFPLDLTAEWRAELQTHLQRKLTEMLGVEVDTVMADYVLAMVGNKKDMAQIAQALVDFVGDESAEQFVAWLSGVLPTYEAKGGDQAADATPAAPDATADANADESANAAPPAKRIINLKNSSSSATAEPKIVSLSSSRGSIRSLSGAQAPADDVLAKRSARFGAVEKSVPKPKPAREEPKAVTAAGGAAKRKASAEPESSRRGSGGGGGRLSQLLGPPVNVDQAELDARDSLNTNKRKKVNPRAAEPERERSSRSSGRNDRNDRSSRNNQENQDADGNRKSSRRPEPKDPPARPGDAPPLPPNDQLERPDKFGAPRDDGRGPQHGGYFNGPPGYGGFPPPPFGHPMYFQPPPFGQMPPPYGMGFPPPHGGPGYYGGPGPYGGRRSSAPMGGAPQGGRGPRAGFQNRTWVNPNAVKTEEAKAEGASSEEGGAAGAAAQAGTASSSSSSAAGGGLNPGAPAFAPRNPPYYGSQMRPFFQNKTWVRQDPVKDEEFSLTLPTTPPPDGADAAE